jgi:glycosyltransferase involved in cell wall biosynthesis
MRIAEIAPLYESVPPKLYGGTERVVSCLTEALVSQGHNVTLFASGDSVTQAELRPGCRRALRMDPLNVDALADHVLMAEQVLQASDEFDVVHSHIDYTPYPLWRRMKTPRVTTLHGRLNISNLRSLYQEFFDEPVISISNHQRQPLPWANWQTTIYHGLPTDLYRPRSGSGGYLAFLGRVSPEKRVDHAIEIAMRAGLPLKIAAKIDKQDQDYFQANIKPLLKCRDVEYVGEIGDAEKNAFLGDALALLFPIDWPEPFGLVMIEAMACGTPIIARARGSVPEIIDDGVTGYIVHNVEEAVQAVTKVSSLSRKRCRQIFEERFTADRMARDYVCVFEQLTHRETIPLRIDALPS